MDLLRLAGTLSLVLACGSEAIVEDPMVGSTFAATPSPGTEPVRGDATVEQLAGDVRVRRVEAGAWVPLRVGDRLAPGDTLQTMNDGSALLRFAGSGARSAIEADTTLQLPPAPERTTRLAHVTGRLSVTLAEGATGERVEVQLPPGTLVLRGDEAQVEAEVQVDDARTTVAMLRGQGTLDRESAESVAIPARNFVELADTGEVLDRGGIGPPVTLLAPPPAAELVTRGRVRFRWEPLSEDSSYRVEIFSEDEVAVQVEDASADSVLLPLRSGHYRWRVRALRDGVPQRSGELRALSVEVDAVAPPIELMAPAEGATIAGSTVQVRGRTEPRARVWVAGELVSVDERGAFSREVPIARGITNIVVRAEDALGNRRSSARSVVRP